MFIYGGKKKTPEEIRAEKIAKEATQLKEELSKMPPEERARFWAEHDRNTSGDHGKTESSKSRSNQTVQPTTTRADAGGAG